MSASPIHVQKRSAGSVSVTSPLLRHLNMGTLAVILFLAFVLQNTTRGKEPATRESAPPRLQRLRLLWDNFRVSPETFMIPTDAAVTWTNHLNAPHVVTSADNQVQQSPILKTARSFFDTLATAENYSYFCAIQPRMTEKIKVK
jgi:hypothetical protein